MERAEAENAEVAGDDSEEEEGMNYEGGEEPSKENGAEEENDED